MRPALATLLFLALCSSPVGAQDAARGRLLFEKTSIVTGKPVGNCVACHANQSALREMISNRGGKASDPRSIRRILQLAIDGAAPGAVNAKAQYRGVLTPKDLDDLAVYIAGAKGAVREVPSVEMEVSDAVGTGCCSQPPVSADH
ncbi:MAG TPA: cytochrome c [Burkholderiaceae bacterium]|nr:cytochrome c [Burkholderiaceae bacterium]